MGGDVLSSYHPHMTVLFSPPQFALPSTIHATFMLGPSFLTHVRESDVGALRSSLVLFLLLPQGMHPSLTCCHLISVSSYGVRSQHVNKLHRTRA